MKFCMIDLETLALTNDAYILSCGAVMMDTDKSLMAQPTNHYYIRMPFNQPGRIIDPNTVFWHVNNTSLETREDTFGKDRLKFIKTFFDDFISWYRVYEPDTVWSKGADFDIAILEHLFNQFGEKVPWSYKDKRCYRTVLEFAFGFEKIKKKILRIPGNTEDTKAHTALKDALSQAKTLWHIYQEFEDGINLL
jgi:hypothetical protein